MEEKFDALWTARCGCDCGVDFSYDDGSEGAIEYLSSIVILKPCKTHGGE